MRRIAASAAPALRLTALLAAAVAASVAVFLLCDRFDNKYASGSPQPVNGILLVDEALLARQPVLFLVEGWELYNGLLLTPEDLRASPLLPGKTVFIGEYAGFEAGDADALPHGSATLCLNIAVPDAPRDYMLELPEIYSAYNLYINGRQVKTMGDPDPAAYRAETGNSFVVFEASGNIEILLAMTDYSHYYSGLVYPPAFGEPDAVAALLYKRFAIRAALCGVALSAGCLYLIAALALVRPRGEGRRLAEASEASLAALYGLLCLCFVGYAGYPVIKTLHRGGIGWYTLENVCHCGMLLLVMLLQGRLCSIRRPVRVAFAAGGGLVCAAALCLPLIVRSGLGAMMAFSRALDAYFILCAAALTWMAVRGIRSGGAGDPAMLFGAAVFDVALVMDRLLPDYEPILTGWFSEWAGAALVLCTGVAIALRIAAQMRERAELRHRIEGVERLMELHKAYYPAALEQAEEARRARHDLRHHIAAIKAYADDGALDSLSEYLARYTRTVAEPPSVIFGRHPALNVVLRHFAALAKAGETRFTVRTDLSETAAVDDAELTALLGNLLENAIEAAARLPAPRRWVEAVVSEVPGSVVIAVDNAFDGVVLYQGGLLLSRKGEERAGIGTQTVRDLAERRGGTVSFTREERDGVFIFRAEIILPVA